jgi:hypothetical protein
MPLFRHNQPNHSVLLMPVRLRSERWPKNKVRVLSCDAEGNLFTELIGRSIYQRIKLEAQRMEAVPKNYATIYLETGNGQHVPLFVEIGDKENWALERILEHALRSGIVPHVLITPIRDIIRLGETKYKEVVTEKTKRTRKTTSQPSSKVLGRLPYYKTKDIEVSVPIYKTEYAFPLIVLGRLSQESNMAPNQQRVLVLDSDGDLAETSLPSEQVNKAERNLRDLRKKGKEGSLVCLWEPEGISVDVVEMSELQVQALEAVTHYFKETSKDKRPLSAAIKTVLYDVRNRSSS